MYAVSPVRHEQWGQRIIMDAVNSTINELMLNINKAGMLQYKVPVATLRAARHMSHVT